MPYEDNSGVFSVAPGDQAPLWEKDELYKLGFTDEEINMARREHIHKAVDYCGASTEDMMDEFGTGVVRYFDFLKFIFGMNMLLVVLQLVNYIIFSAEENPRFSNDTPDGGTNRRWYHSFFLTEYTSDQRAMWMSINIIAIVIIFSMSVVYYVTARNYRHKVKRQASRDLAARREAAAEDPSPAAGRRMADNDHHRNDELMRFNDDGSMCVSQYFRSSVDLFLRRLVSFLVFAALITAQVFISYYLTREQDGSNSVGVSFGIAFIISAANLTYQLLAETLTEFEKWQSLTRYKGAHTSKLILFRLCNIITVYSAKDYHDYKGCAYDLLGEQFLTILIVEILIMNPLSIVMSLIRRRITGQWAAVTNTILGDQDLLPAFDIAVEYLGVLYRQYLVVMAMTVFPLSILIAQVGYIIDFATDRLRLFTICGRPRKLSKSPKEFLALNLLLIASAALFTPFVGTFWMMKGTTKSVAKVSCQLP